jgi:2',3'-cyclic-nucleotide 2'-phosphodiesterase (5'-nucleotidase family)
VVVAKSTVEIDSRSSSVRSQETLIGDLICDAMRHSTGAQICLTNGGSIRGNRVYPAGTNITRQDVLSELPFGNRLVLVELTGREIKAALENGVSQIDSRVGRFPQLSGMRVTIDRKAAAGSRVTRIEHDGKPLDPNGRYKLVTNDFLFGGGDGYEALARGRVLIGKTDGILVANAVMAYLRTLATITTGTDGRLLLK